MRIATAEENATPVATPAVPPGGKPTESANPGKHQVLVKVPGKTYYGAQMEREEAAAMAAKLAVGGRLSLILSDDTLLILGNEAVKRAVYIVCPYKPAFLRKNRGI